VMEMKIKNIHARQILDSRGNPTVEVELTATNKNTQTTVRASVPSGASTGAHEAVELRDKKKAWLGKGVGKAVQHVNTLLARKLKGKELNQLTVDTTMLGALHQKNKAWMGANAVLGVSLAAARCAAQAQNKPLYGYLAELAHNTKNKRMCMPVPFANIINGGKHAAGKLAIQEFMIAPVKAKNTAQAIQMVSEAYHVLGQLLAKKYGNSSTHVGDEGGYAPPLDDAFDALNIIEKAINQAGYSKKIKIAMDAAASEFYNSKKKTYQLKRVMDADKLLEYYWNLLDDYPIISLEDPFAEDDFQAWHNLMQQMNKGRIKKAQIVGDDLLVTNLKRIEMGFDKKLCNALLLKVNQIGTITEALSAANFAQHHKWNVMVSHRSGETCDDFIADLAVALGCGQIKLGAPCRGERTAKYNQLLRIEEALGKKARYGA
jgi:enolase